MKILLDTNILLWAISNDARLLEKHIFVLEGLKREKDAPPHKDPFDRMLICQAETENMMFVTQDSLIIGYTAPCILAV